MACSYFGEIHVFDLDRRATVRSAKREEEMLRLGVTDKHLLGADWKSKLYAYDPATLEQLWVLDLGRDKSADKHQADLVSAPLFDSVTNTVYVPRADTRCALVSLAKGAPRLGRAFCHGDELGRHGDCFLLGNHLFEYARKDDNVGLVRSGVKSGGLPESFNLGRVAEQPMDFTVLRGGSIAGLFREREPRRGALKVYDANLVQRSATDIPLRAPFGMATGPGDLLAVTGMDGVVMLRLEGGRVTWSKLVQLPYPYKVPNQNETPVRAGP